MTLKPLRKLFKRKSKLEKFYDKNKQFIWYSIVSIICTIILFILFFITDKLTHGNYLIANFVSYTISFTLLYFGDRMVFNSKPKLGKNKLTQGVSFIIVRVIGFPIDSAVLGFLITHFDIGNMWAKVICTLIMFMYNYVTNKLFVFKSERL